MRIKDSLYSVLFVSVSLVCLLALVSTNGSAACNEENDSNMTQFAYVTNSGSDTVSVIDKATDTVTATIDVGSSPHGVAVTPNGKKVYVTNWGSSTVSVVDTATKTVTKTVSVGDGTYGVAVNPDGTKVYVANAGCSTVSIIDTATDTVLTKVDIKDGAWGVAVSPDGKRVYVTNSEHAGAVSVIDTTTNIVMETVRLVSLTVSDVLSRD